MCVRKCPSCDAQRTLGSIPAAAGCVPRIAEIALACMMGGNPVKQQNTPWKEDRTQH